MKPLSRIWDVLERQRRKAEEEKRWNELWSDFKDHPAELPNIEELNAH